TTARRQVFHCMTRTHSQTSKSFPPPAPANSRPDRVCLAACGLCIRRNSVCRKMLTWHSRIDAKCKGNLRRAEPGRTACALVLTTGEANGEPQKARAPFHLGRGPVQWSDDCSVLEQKPAEPNPDASKPCNKDAMPDPS